MTAHLGAEQHNMNFASAINRQINRIKEFFFKKKNESPNLGLILVKGVLRARRTIFGNVGEKIE